ncbi:hypothetical protein AGR4C_Cc160278 [Agrobacterium tumefaciens str. Kerr 14]|uniref:Uncharacterized protein n=1 Tax=Agrobacterium tumefaciens str. Kerr 14 TaxID=1183424 RepID=A0A1S7PB53_AGRTU|nr:hypothetical protein AGR4C_Cc160278 [Agrobacterium tumefaciens str. Kerr 14]
MANARFYGISIAQPICQQAALGKPTRELGKLHAVYSRYPSPDNAAALGLCCWTRPQDAGNPIAGKVCGSRKNQ